MHFSMASVISSLYSIFSQSIGTGAQMRPLTKDQPPKLQKQNDIMNMVDCSEAEADKLPFKERADENGIDFFFTCEMCSLTICKWYHHSDGKHPNVSQFMQHTLQDEISGIAAGTYFAENDCVFVVVQVLDDGSIVAKCDDNNDRVRFNNDIEANLIAACNA